LKYYNKIIYKLFTIVCLAGLMAAGMSAEIMAAAATRVQVSSMTKIDGEQILLGKIAKIESHDPLLSQRIGAVVIGRSPLPGKRREIDAGLVERRLQQNRIDPDQLVLQIPSRIVVERSFIEIDQEKIKALVSDYIAQNLISNLSDARIKDIQVSDNLILPGGRITYSVKPPRNDTLAGKIPLTVNFDVNGKFYKRVWASATIEIFTNVVVTKKPLGRHKPISEDDIEMQRMDLAQLPADVITDPEVILGQRTRRAIGSHTVLRSNLVEFPPLVKRGDVVVILAETGGLKITTVGQVKRKGRLGERIPVMNFDSKKILYAQVLDSNTVKVEFN
jgi:flagella basal body P-ring formation protein FlgA